MSRPPPRLPTLLVLLGLLLLCCTRHATAFLPGSVSPPPSSTPGGRGPASILQGQLSRGVIELAANDDVGLGFVAGGEGGRGKGKGKRGRGKEGQGQGQPNPTSNPNPTPSRMTNRRQLLLWYTRRLRACGPNQWREALKLMEEIEASGVTPDLFCLNVLMDVMAKAGKWRRCLELLEGMGLRGLKPDAVSFNTAIHACARKGQVSWDSVRMGELGVGVKG